MKDKEHKELLKTAQTINDIYHKVLYDMRDNPELTEIDIWAKCGVALIKWINAGGKID